VRTLALILVPLLARPALSMRSGLRALGFFLAAIVSVRTLLIASPARAQDVTIALDGAADLSPVYPMDKVPANIRQFVAIATNPESGSHQFTGTVAAVDRRTELPAQPASVIESLPAGQGTRVLFRFSFPADLPVGRLRAQITVDGKGWADHEFAVIPPAVVSGTPDAVFLAGSLAEGTEWQYDYRVLQQPSPGFAGFDRSGRLRLPAR
jgi:hypothetical protein